MTRIIVRGASPEFLASDRIMFVFIHMKSFCTTIHNSVQDMEAEVTTLSFTAWAYRLELPVAKNW